MRSEDESLGRVVFANDFRAESIGVENGGTGKVLQDFGHEDVAFTFHPEARTGD